jgi:hypothetical protein
MDPFKELRMDGQMNDQDAAAMLAGLGIVLFVVLAVAFVVQVVFTWLLWDSYRVVPQQFQKLPAGLVWLALIPCLGLIVWIAAMIMVPMSFRDAFAARGRSDFGDCGAKFGYGYLAGAVLGLIPFIGPLFSIGALICWIMFMVKCRQMKSAILAG